MTVRSRQGYRHALVVEYAKRFGIYDDLKPYLPMGSVRVKTTVLRLTAAYATIANGGKRVNATFIDRIQDRWGKTIYKHDQRVCEGCDATEWAHQDEPKLIDNAEQCLDPMTAYQITSIMEGVVQRGTATVLSDLADRSPARPVRPTIPRTSGSSASRRISSAVSSSATTSRGPSSRLAPSRAILPRRARRSQFVPAPARASDCGARPRRSLMHAPSRNVLSRLRPQVTRAMHSAAGQVYAARHAARGADGDQARPSPGTAAAGHSRRLSQARLPPNARTGRPQKLTPHSARTEFCCLARRYRVMQNGGMRSPMIIDHMLIRCICHCCLDFMPSDLSAGCSRFSWLVLFVGVRLVLSRPRPWSVRRSLRAAVRQTRMRVP